jgi:hypothetical protein
MVNDKIYLILLGTFLFMMGPLQVYAGESIASPQLIAQRMGTPREYIITIKGEVSENKLITKLDPREVRAGSADIVTFVNDSQVEVRIKFGKGTGCKEVSVKALGWRLEPGKCYETKDTLKPGDTTTIPFKEIGIYNYEIVYIGKDRKEYGIVHVQTERR